MAIVETRRITKLFDEVRAVDGINLIAKEGEFLVLARPIGLRQDDVDAPDRRPRAADLGRYRD